MRWGKGKVDIKPEPECKFWFAWYPVKIYENRWVWWEWTMRSPGIFCKWAYETFYNGKKPGKDERGQKCYMKKIRTLFQNLNS